MKERLEDVLRPDEVADDLVLLLRGGVHEGEIAQLQRQARDLDRRFSWRGGGPCYGVSVFAATPETEGLILATRMDARRRYCRILYRDIAGRLLVLPTFRRPHRTVMFNDSDGPDYQHFWTPTESCGTTSILGSQAWKEDPMSSMNDRALGAADYLADLEVDFANEDQTGLVWAWLDHARDESVVAPGAVLILRDGEDFAVGQVVDLVRVDQGTVVHLRLLPGAVEDYHAALERAAPRSA